VQSSSLGITPFLRPRRLIRTTILCSRSSDKERPAPVYGGWLPEQLGLVFTVPHEATLRSGSQTALGVSDFLVDTFVIVGGLVGGVVLGRKSGRVSRWAQGKLESKIEQARYYKNGYRIGGPPISPTRR
jgi:hypothetical protein